MVLKFIADYKQTLASVIIQVSIDHIIEQKHEENKAHKQFSQNPFLFLLDFALILNI